MSNVIRLEPNGTEPVTVLEVALNQSDDFAEVLVIGFLKNCRRGAVVYGSKGIDEVRLAHATLLCQDTAMRYLDEQVEHDF